MLSPSEADTPASFPSHHPAPRLHHNVHPTHANTQEFCCATHVCATHSQNCVHTAVHTHTAVTMLSAQRIVSSALYTPVHSHVMEGICTAGALEEGGIVWQVRTRTRIPHTQTHRSTAGLNMYVLHRESLVNVYWKSWSPQSSRYRSAVGTFRCMVCRDSAAARGGGTP